MSDTLACKFGGRNEPRIVPGRHGDECEGEQCSGCQPCEESHCRACRRTHADQTCAECLAATRDDLREIGRLCDALPAEVEHRGVNGEAMMLLGPAANPEAWGHREASARSGRISADYLEDARDEQHPLFVLGSWEMVYREHFEQPTDLAATLPRLIDYLDRQLHVVAAEPLIPFEDFAREVRGCRGHLEDVLRDGVQRDTGAPCIDCGVPLVREWGKLVAADGWRCPRCKEFYTEDQYRFAVQHLHRAEATHLTDRDCEIRTGVRAATIRSWARHGDISKRQDSGRVVYVVAEVEARAKRTRPNIGTNLDKSGSGPAQSG